jgi:hypothetical protein
VAKLNQIIAVEKGVKSTAESVVTKAYHDLQRNNLLAGISRTYQPKDEEGEQLPPESTRVQLSVSQVLQNVAEGLAQLLDVTLTKDIANTTAKADIVVGARTLATDVPVTYLLFLEKKLTDLRTLISKIPTLDPAEQWSFNQELGVWTTEPVRTVRSKKVPRNHVKAEATERHPAQVDVWMEDISVGYWTTIKASGATPLNHVNELLSRIGELQRAVKYAREEANGSDVHDYSIGGPLFHYLFNG